MRETTIKTLRRLGFTEYEARAYISLVGFGMATAREIHETSGVPQGRIYSVLRSLSDKNYIEIQNGNPSYFYADNPGAILNKLKTEMNNSINESIEYLSNLHLNSKPPSPIWAISSEWGIKNRIKTLIQGADREIIILVYDPSLLGWILPELKKIKRRVNIEIYAKNKDDFAGTNLRVTEYPEKMYSMMEKVTSMEKNVYGVHEAKMNLLIDESTGFFIGKTQGTVTGVIAQSPQLVYTIRAFMKMLGDE
ncbi:TrmB family transcriptional regulator [Methanofollis fontis]|uniref:TrmB family transcriptional regulator n=1 Tax=Methanofollis fontis TaxID=2052832 RepID=A0A483CTM8_9EURY|nr:helix-turn-helix domain-containing protein [Methanofollis fontis]TAJ44064.1 TrmB family transcriptional regulator [Methanofollis fontis]